MLYKPRSCKKSTKSKENQVKNLHKLSREVTKHYRALLARAWLFPVTHLIQSGVCVSPKSTSFYLKRSVSFEWPGTVDRYAIVPHWSFTYVRGTETRLVQRWSVYQPVSHPPCLSGRRCRSSGINIGASIKPDAFDGGRFLLWMDPVTLGCSQRPGTTVVPCLKMCFQQHYTIIAFELGWRLQ